MGIPNRGGAEVTAVEIKDITLPENMQCAMAKEAEAERERRAKIVGAEGEFQAAVKLGEAADIGEKLHDHFPSAVHDDCAGGVFDDQARYK
jgi:regulator of protease activity HflC (stomatin/prohibitin superfamily)